MELKLINVTKRFGHQAALDSVSFTVPSTVKCLVLLGASGSGKSTLLRVLGSLLPTEAGEIQLDAKTLPCDEKGMLRERRKKGYVFQSFNLFPHISALQNIALPLQVVHQFTETAAKKRAHELLERFGLEQHAEKQPVTLSGGQQQRVALARALAAKPELLLLDEPTSALDPMMTAEVLEVLRDVINQGQQVVLSTHEVTFARIVADWVVFLAGGRVLENCEATQFFNRPQSAEAQQFLDALLRYH